MKLKDLILALLSFLKIDAFKKVENKTVLSDDEKTKIKDKFGELFLTKFEADLKEYEETGVDNYALKVAERMSAIESRNAELIVKLAEQDKTINKLSDGAESDPVYEVTTETVDGKKRIKVKPNMRLSHNKLASDYLGGNQSVLAGDTTIDTDDVLAEFGDLVNYYKPEVLLDILTGFPTAKMLTWKRGIKSWKATKALITSVVQQFTDKWTPAGKTTFTPIEIPLYRHKINLPIRAVDVEDWIFGMYDESKDLDKHPVTLYILNNLLKPRALEDIEHKMICNGVYDEIDWDTVEDGDAGQVPEKSMNGFMTILKNYKAAGTSNINFIDLGTITDSNIVDKFNDFVDEIDEVYQAKNMPIICSLTTYKQYKRAYKKQFGENTPKSDDPQFGSDTIDYSKNRLVWLPSMSGQCGFFATPKENFIGLRHKNEVGTTRIFMQKENYTLKVFGEFRLGVGFAMQEAVFVYLSDDDSASASVS